MRLWVLGFFFLAATEIAAAAATESYTPTTLTAEQVFAKARTARGHLRSAAYHRVSETVRGDGNVHTDVYEDGDDFVETQQEGPFTTAFGSDRGVEWDEDENGAVTVVSGFHDTDDPFSAALSKPSTTTGSQIKVLGVTTSQPQCIVVEVTPRSGLIQHRYYDAKTFLLRRVQTTAYGGQTSTFDYDNFRTAYGLTFAQSITYTDDHPENTARTTVESLQPVPRSAVHSAMPASKPLFDLAGRSSVQIPAEFSPDGIIVRVTIAGRGLDFQLDSGSSTIAIDADVAHQLGLTTSDKHKESFGGDFTVGRTRVADLGVGGLHARNVTMDVFSFQRDAGEQQKVVGLLGGDFFASQRVSVDYKNGKLVVMPSSKEAPPAPWVTIPIQVDDRVPRAHAKFNSVDGAFIVDLGAFETLLYPHFFRQFHPNRPGDVIGQVIGVAGKAIDYHQYTFSRFDFGDLAFADASAIVTSGTKFEDLDYDGALGRNILSNFNLIFDYPTGKLYIQSMVQ